MDQEQQAKLIKFLINLLSQSPNNADDAFRLYNSVIDKIAHHLITNLPEDEEKARMMQTLLEKIINKKVVICDQ
jgi:predicted 3-demethylubiquinone-9 3-methyltransferase (glyoxalase superfamily)